MDNPKIEVTLTEDDYYAFNAFSHFRLRETRHAVLFAQLALPGAYLLYYAWSHWRKHNADLLGPDSVGAMMRTVVFLLFFAVMIGVFMRASIRNETRKKTCQLQGNFFGKLVSVELREDGIYEKFAFGENTYPYALVDEIVENKGRVYVCLGKEKGLIFPRDRIPRETLDAFLDELKKRLTCKTPGFSVAPKSR